jgi:hypothetical protein
MLSRSLAMFGGCVLLGGWAQPARCGGTSQSTVAWTPSIEVASGGGERGPWRQNESQFDFVDDPTVVLADDGAAYVAWVDQGAKQVRLQVYEAGGAARLPRPTTISRSPDVFSWLPRLAISPDGREVFVLWQEIVFSGGSHGGDIFFARSLDGGETFEPPLDLSDSVAGAGKGRITSELWHNGSLALARADDGVLYAAWTEYEGRLWASRSTDRGASFGSPVLVDDGRDAPARAPALAVGPAGDLFLAWTTGESDTADVRIAVSRDRGASFGDPVYVARTAGYSDAPSLAVDAAGVVHVAFGESRGGRLGRFEVHYTRSFDGARGFETVRQLSRSPLGDARSAGYPALAIDGAGGVYVVWELGATARTPSRGLGFNYSLDDGARFRGSEVVPESLDPAGGLNGSLQGHLTRKLDARGGTISIVNSAFVPGEGSRVWLVRGTPHAHLAPDST